MTSQRIGRICALSLLVLVVCLFTIALQSGLPGITNYGSTTVIQAANTVSQRSNSISSLFGENRIEDIPQQEAVLQLEPIPDARDIAPINLNRRGLPIYDDSIFDIGISDVLLQVEKAKKSRVTEKPTDRYSRFRVDPSDPSGTSRAARARAKNVVNDIVAETESRVRVVKHTVIEKSDVLACVGVSFNYGDYANSTIVKNVVHAMSVSKNIVYVVFTSIDELILDLQIHDNVYIADNYEMASENRPHVATMVTTMKLLMVKHSHAPTYYGLLNSNVIMADIVAGLSFVIGAIQENVIPFNSVLIGRAAISDAEQCGGRPLPTVKILKTCIYSKYMESPFTPSNSPQYVFWTDEALSFYKMPLLIPDNTPMFFTYLLAFAQKLDVVLVDVSGLFPAIVVDTMGSSWSVGSLQGYNTDVMKGWNAFFIEKLKRNKLGANLNLVDFSLWMRMDNYAVADRRQGFLDSFSQAEQAFLAPLLVGKKCSYIADSVIRGSLLSECTLISTFTADFYYTFVRGTKLGYKNFPFSCDGLVKCDPFYILNRLIIGARTGYDSDVFLTNADYHYVFLDSTQNVRLLSMILKSYEGPSVFVAKGMYCVKHASMKNMIESSPAWEIIDVKTGVDFPYGIMLFKRKYWSTAAATKNPTTQ